MGAEVHVTFQVCKDRARGIDTMSLPD
jgi:hypothetical protein